MFTRTKFFLLLFVLHCPPSLLIPLAQKDVASASNINNLVVLETNQVEQISPNNSNIPEIIQQIDVKDDENHVMSNINHVVIGDESNETIPSIATENDTSNKTLSNETNVGANHATVPIRNVHGLQNPLNTTNNANVNNATIKEVGTVQKGTTSNVNMNSTLVPYISGGTTTSTDGENVARLIINLSSGAENKETNVPILETIDGENVLHESLNDAEVELAWRSDVPVGKNETKKIRHIAKLVSQNATLHASKINGSVNYNNSDLLDSDNDKEKSIFVILNSGNIYGLSVNSPANSGNLQTQLANNYIVNLNFSNAKILNDLINLTINDFLSKIMQQNVSNLNPTRIFLLLNSGTISNVHVSSPVLENILKNTALKDRSRRHLNESNTNNTDVQSVKFKLATDTSNPSIDVKFRIGEHQGTLDSKQNNTTLGSNAPVKVTFASSNTTLVEIPNDDISSAEAPAFRSLIPDKTRKLHQVSNIVNNELNQNKDHKLVLNLSPESAPISIDLNQIPLNNLLGGALSFIKRLKRNTHDKSEHSYPWKHCRTKQIDEHHTVTSCKKSKLNNNDLTIPTRKSFNDDNSNVLNLNDSVELVCPLSVIVKLYTHQVLDNISKNEPESVLNTIISSFVNGNEDAINLTSKELFDLPVPVKIRLQLVHGKTKEYMEQLRDMVDATLCSLA